MSDRSRIAVSARFLRVAFANFAVPIAVRLWDGTVVEAGAPGTPRFTLALGSRRIFRKLLLRPKPLAFGEAYIAGDIDIEGDIFEAMRAAHRLEDFALPLRTRLRLLPLMLRL